MTAATPEQTFSTCIHEASHCTLGVFLLAEVHGARIWEDGQGIATAKPEDAKPLASMADEASIKDMVLFSDDKMTAKNFLNHCIVNAAGYTAQQIFCGHNSEQLFEDVTDTRLIKAKLQSIFPDMTEETQTAFICFLSMLTKPLVKKYERYIFKVAAVLNEKKILSPDEMLAAMFPGKVIL
jgi:hypothetical protein